MLGVLACNVQFSSQTEWRAAGLLPWLSTSMSSVGVRLSERAQDNLRGVRVRARRNNIQSEMFILTINNHRSL